MGGGAFDLYRICEEMARIDLGIATGVLATFLGSDPISVGGTPEQKKRWMTPHRRRRPADGLRRDRAGRRQRSGRAAHHGRAASRRTARSSATRSTAPSSGSATAASPTLYTILANAPGGPSWFVVEKGTPGFSHGKPEDKHGIRASNTAALVARRRLRRRRPAGRRRRRPGAAPGAGGVRLHAPDGRGLRPGRRLGGARPRHSLLDDAHPGRWRRSPRSRATRTS